MSGLSLLTPRSNSASVRGDISSNGDKLVLVLRGHGSLSSHGSARTLRASVRAEQGPTQLSRSSTQVELINRTPRRQSPAVLIPDIVLHCGGESGLDEGFTFAITAGVGAPGRHPASQRQPSPRSLPRND